MKRYLKLALLVLLLQPVFTAYDIGTPLVWGPPGVFSQGLGFAQTAPPAASDPCSLFPHAVATIPSTANTQLLVTGVAGKVIYICGYHFTVGVGAPTASPVLFLSYGSANVAGTPCATSSPSYTPVIFESLAGGYNASAREVNAGDAFAVASPVPTGAASPSTDLCIWNSGGAVMDGIIEYVQHKFP